VGSFRADLVVENEVIVEIKSLAGNIPALFEYQLLSYLKASKHHLGLLIKVLRGIEWVKTLWGYDYHP